MRLNHPDYIKLVIEAYKKKRANNELSLLLAQSTPAKIRQACLHLYREYFDKKEQQVLRKDEQVLKDFFGPAEPGKQFLQLIRDFETDRFRPLDKYLKGNTENTDNTNLELLAWLINFQHRPFSFGMEVVLNEDERIIIGKSLDGAEENIPEPNRELNDLEKNKEETGVGAEQAKKNVLNEQEVSLINNRKPKILSFPNPANNSQKNTFKKAAIIFLMLIICTGGIYAVWQQMKNVNAVGVRWAGDHYEEVPGNADSKGEIILSMNLDKVKRFRKITQEDTITEYSIGKIYYIKDSNIIKYYTESGNYPEDVTRNLKPLSRYMFEKYLRKKENPVKDSLADPKTKFINN